MRQERIYYSDVIDLGFKEDKINDGVFYDQYGFEYSIVVKYLTDEIFLDWDKVTGFCEMVRVKNEGEKILGRMPIKDLTHLEKMIAFFSDAQTEEPLHA